MRVTLTSRGEQICQSTPSRVNPRHITRVAVSHLHAHASIQSCSEEILMQVAPNSLVPEFVVSPAFSGESHRVVARRCAHGCALALSSALVLLVLGCGSTGYVTPGGGAPLGSLTSQPIAQQLQLVPESPMPAGLAFTRVQAVGYRSCLDFAPSGRRLSPPRRTARVRSDARARRRNVGRNHPIAHRRD